MSSNFQPLLTFFYIIFFFFLLIHFTAVLLLLSQAGTTLKYRKERWLVAWLCDQYWIV